ncbi:DUF3939 domain-containing protein [Pontibacillus litoralis]|uniref:DUF3939 domain-containing protein n=1 Tax=Pontibacillus litoralis JSM 072002 TaxID=1385512 RepID=A0A0A5HME2_9BACI|nr:DUF3939 domain-containing protein [Pontibacillus litoralis]KGX84797.1 hypothetical protein N784_11945 [Pontibacillus litoralis JSM 072002]
MWGKWKRKQQRKKEENKERHVLNQRNVSLLELRQAIYRYMNNLPDGIELQTIINEDNTIDYELLSPYLGAIPIETYYMSKETYEVFEEHDYHLVLDIDRIQQAVDKYMKQMSELPVIEGDPFNKVNFYKLEKAGLLKERPDRVFYMTEDEYMITHRQPERK